MINGNYQYQDHKGMHSNNFNQSRMSNNALFQNKNIINRKSNVSPLVTNKNYNQKGMRQ